LYILALDGTSGLMLANDNLKADLTTALQAVQMFTDFVCLRDGIVILVDIHIDATLDRSYKKFEAEISANINNLLNGFFALSNWEYGQALRSTDITKALSSVQQVSFYDVTFATVSNTPGVSSTVVSNPDVCAPTNSVITVAYNEIIRPDTIVVNFTYEDS
jgi:hypothetical protein